MRSIRFFGICVLTVVLLFHIGCLPQKVFASGDAEILEQQELKVEKDNASIYTSRLNLDVASILSALSIGLLKFFDEHLKKRFKGNLKSYKRFYMIAWIVFGLLELSIILCVALNRGSILYGNTKNVVLCMIPTIFCFLTWKTAKDENGAAVLSQKQLEGKINDFTSSGMSPLGMIVGDMDFFGSVYSSNTPNNKRKNDITRSTQISTLLDNKIDDIRIVCKEPVTSEDKKRIGYLLARFDQRIEIRFFDRSVSIPKVRGRIMYKHDSRVVVITRKIKKQKEYEYSEHRGDSLPGGLFSDLWESVWSGGKTRPDILEECKKAYNQVK